MLASLADDNDDDDDSLAASQVAAQVAMGKLAMLEEHDSILSQVGGGFTFQY